MSKSKLFLSFVAVLIVVLLIGCESNVASNKEEVVASEEETESVKETNDNYTDTITIVWYPNASGLDFQEAREAIGGHIEDALGKQVDHQLTTDYAIAIESIANGNANVASMGAAGYIEAHEKNENVLPLVVSSGESGTLEDAKYYSWFAVKKGNEEKYSDGKGGFKIDNIKGQVISFVSNSSTSGFVVPSSEIIDYFPEENLDSEDLMEGGDNKFFSEVMFGGSHQGSLMNLLTERSDVAAFCNSSVRNYVEVKEGDPMTVGSTYVIKEDAPDPFADMGGEEFVIISVTPVLNSPVVVNLDVTSPEDVELLRDTYENAISNDPAAYNKKGDSRFVSVEDSWFDPIRVLKEK